jgi:hypothetical protein
MINQPERKGNIKFCVTNDFNRFDVWSLENMRDIFNSVNGVSMVTPHAQIRGLYYVTVSPLYDIGEVQLAMEQVANLVANGELGVEIYE